MNRIFTENSSTDSGAFFSLEGKLLVATPQWDHEDFKQSVCLVVHHSRDGAVGILLNREFDMEAQGLWQHLSGGKLDLRSELLHLGGPQSGPVVALHNCDSLAEFETADGVYLAAEIENLQSLIQTTIAEVQPDCDLKIIVGQADWDSGELEDQLLNGCWLPIATSSEIVFEDQDKMWPKAMAKIGNEYVSAITGALPTSDPLLN